MFAFVHSAQDNGWRPEGDTITMYNSPAFEQREQKGIISQIKEIVRTRQARRLEAVDLMGGIRNKGHQIKSEDIIPWINDLEIEDIFEDEDEEEGMGVTDLINGLV